MIALIPLSRFKITYRVATGRPYSKFEHLVLRAVAEGATDLRALHDIFRIHSRLVIEALVTLIQAGWIVVGGFGRPAFLLSSDGRRALDSGETPETLVVFTPPPTVVVMERLTGALLPNTELRFWSRIDLKAVWNSSMRLVPAVSETALDQGQVQHLIPRRREEWLRWVGPIELIGQGAHWLPVDVSPDRGRVNGLPDAWRARLTDLILDEARHQIVEMDEESANQEWYADRPNVSQEPDPGRYDSLEPDLPKRPTGEFFIAVESDDFLFGALAHGDYLRTAITRARSAVLIASAFLRMESICQLENQLLSALARGVRIDLLWGYTSADNADQKAALDWLRKLAHTAKGRGLPGRIWFNAAPSDSHMKVLIYDTEEDDFEGCVGSFNWLSSVKAEKQSLSSDTLEISLLLHDALLLASLVRCVAGVCASLPSERISSTSDRWMTIASDLEKHSLTTQDLSMEKRGVNAKAKIILDREHETLVREWSGSAQQRLMILSHRLGVIASARLARLVSARRDTNFDCMVGYGYSELPAEDLSLVDERVRSVGGQLAHVDDLHAKVVASERAICISSYNFLSADPFGKAAYSRELGIALEGASADAAYEKLRAWVKES